MTDPAVPRNGAEPGGLVRPDYGGAWVGGIVSALLSGDDPEWFPMPASRAAGVVVVVLDGLGWNMLQEHRDRAPSLRQMQGSAITTCAPSTTAAALTSISTGVPPAEHGLVGYRIRVGGQWLNVLTWSVDSGPDPAATQPVAPYGGRRIPVVTRSEFRRTGFTEAHLRGADIVGWKTSAVLVEHVVRLARDGRELVYAYYDGIDKVAHEYGLRNGFVAAEMATADWIVSELLRRLPSGWLVVVTADHGQVHVERDGIVQVHAVASLVGGYGGEGRFRSLTARPGGARDLLQACNEAYGHQAWVFSREQLFDEGLLGPSASLAARSRVGDVVLAARDEIMFVDPALPHEASMLAHHGSLTADEMLVPLLAAEV